MKRLALLLLACVGPSCLASAGWAGPQAPPPSVTVVMATPTGAMSTPTVQGHWQETAPGRNGTLTVQGVAALTTTVTALWTSTPLTLKRAWSGIDINIAWGSNGAAAAGASSTQVLRFRFSDSRGRWGAWKTLNHAVLGASTPESGGEGKDYDLVFSGKTPAKNIRLQVALTDTLAPATELQQTLTIAV